MALFDRFRRNKSNDQLPEEVRDYYQSEQRDRTGRAWLLAIVTLVVTFLLAAALFFGGRWVYRAAFGDDKKPATTTETITGNNDAEGQVSDSAAQTGTSTPTPTSAPSTTNAPSASSATAAPAATPNTGPSALVDTGPGDE
jgi:cytoskeletal protein RodZ